MSNTNYQRNVFINAPFDKKYAKYLNVITFTIAYCGFTPRCAKEAYDSGEVRLAKIARIIRECKLGIHDISRTDHGKNNLPRYNMPFELGVFLGAKFYGDEIQTKKVALILDSEPYRYQQFISDISGQDISSHHNSESRFIKIIRDWLAHHTRKNLSSGSIIFKDYKEFRSDLPKMCKLVNKTISELTYVEWRNLTNAWIQKLEEMRN